VPQDDPAITSLVAAAANKKYRDRSALQSGQMFGHGDVSPQDWVVIIDDEHTPVSICQDETGFDARLNDKDYRIDTEWNLGQPLFKATINGEEVCVQVDLSDAEFSLFHRGAEKQALVVSPRTAELNNYMLHKEPPDMSKYLLSPMPGLLVSLAVAEGDEVKEGEELAVVEAMKMENSLRAVQDGVVKKVSADVGDSLVVDQPIIEFE